MRVKNIYCIINFKQWFSFETAVYFTYATTNQQLNCVSTNNIKASKSIC